MEMRELLDRAEASLEEKIKMRTKNKPENRDRGVERQITNSVNELKALAKKGVGGDIAEREEKIIQALVRSMGDNPRKFVMSMLNVLGAGGDYKRSVM